MTPEEYCQQKTAASGSSFYYSFLFLPPHRRRAITAFYAYCREVDDVVDECVNREVAARKLIWWHEEIENLYAGIPQHPVTKALKPVIGEFDLPKELMLEIIEGMAMDLNHTTYPDFEALSQYCYRVASVVGLLAAEIFGRTEEKTGQYAHDLGMAFQLTNIIRDIREDAQRGRIYLPADELARFDVSIAQIKNGQYSENFKSLMAFQIERAEQYYDKAISALPAADRKAQKPGLIMAAIYRAILKEIKKDNEVVLTRRLTLSPWRKLWLAAQTWIRQ